VQDLFDSVGNYRNEMIVKAAIRNYMENLAENDKKKRRNQIFLRLAENFIKAGVCLTIGGIALSVVI
jgi:hypothetical protein